MSRLIEFKKPSSFQKEMLTLLASLLNGKELKEIRETFAAIDVDSSGSISLSELCQGFRSSGALMGGDERQLDDIMKRVDFNEDGEINYSEFVSGTLDQKLMNKENMWKVFKYLDTSGKEVLTYDILKQAFKRKGDFNETQFNKMMEEVDLSKSPSKVKEGVDFEKFCSIMNLG